MKNTYSPFVDRAKKALLATLLLLGAGGVCYWKNSKRGAHPSGKQEHTAAPAEPDPTVHPSVPAANSSSTPHAKQLFKQGIEAFKKGDYVQANEWYRQAAAEGNANAMYNLFINYRDGLGVPKDPEKAIYWMKKYDEAR